MTTTTGSFGATLQGTLSNTATDTYKLTANSSGKVNINFTHPDGPGTSGVPFELQLVDGKGNVLVDETARGNLSFDTTVSGSGDYYLKVIDANNYDGKAPGSYSVVAALANQPGTTYDGGTNNSSATALTATLGAPLVGSLNNADVDMFKVHTNAGGVIKFDFTHPDGAGTTGAPIAIELTDADGNSVIETSLRGNGTFSTTVAAAGDYYIKVADDNAYSFDDGGLYSLTPTLSTAASTTYDGAANNTTASAIASPMGTPIVGSLNNKDIDVFKVHTDAGGVVKFDFTHPNGAGTSGVPFDIELTDAAGNSVIKSTVYGNSTFASTVAAAGDYYVKISDGNAYNFDDGGIYSLTPSLSTSPATTYDGAANNTSATAIASPMGTSIVGSLNNKDIDVFKVHANAGGVVKFDFAHPNGAGTAGLPFDIELTDAAGNSVIKTTAQGDTTFSTTVAAAGDYYVKVSDGNAYNFDDAGIYRLTPTLSTVDGVVYDGAANDSAATALHMDLPGAASGSLTNRDADYFSFSAGAGGTLTLNVAHPNGAGTAGAAIDVSILDANGNTVLTKTEYGNDLLSTTLPGAGNYYLKVEDGNAYNFNDGGIYTVQLGLAANGGQTLTGTATADKIASTAGNDVINGAGGNDTVVYHGNAANYHVAISAAGVSVIDTTGQDGADTLFNVERLQFADQAMSLDTNGVAAQAYRIYQAAFDRAPDAAGLGYWIANMEKGASLASVAQAFIDSQEFRTMYGAQPSNTDMATKFYTHVLHRAPDQAGLDYWVKALDSHAIDAATALSGFSESAENVAQLTGTISHGIGYQPFG